MSVQSEIQRLQEAKEAIISALKDKGSNIPSNITLDGVAEYIVSLDYIPMKKINITTNTATLEPNNYYNFGSVDSLSLGLSDELEDKRSQYVFTFVATQDFIIEWNSSIHWENGKELLAKTGETYIVTIENNIASYITTEQTQEIAVVDDGMGNISFEMR